MSNEIIKKEEQFITPVENIDFQEEMQGLNITFDRIKVPSGGGLAFEVPGENPDEPDLQKEFSAVILYHHPVLSYYKEKYTGGNEAPDCSSFDGINGVERETGEIKKCKDCPLNVFGTGENGGKACKTKRRIFILRANEMLPTILSLPTASIGDFSKYIMRLVSKGKKSNQVVTKFSLKKVQNAGGITYSKVVLATERDLNEEEMKNIAKMTEQVKAIASNLQENYESEE
ncbi:MAG TPA: hypothetical protein IAC38_00200 [Candidatus Caccovivens faecavium]|nr:hypothetical protein [Candidatus Caccovivens faecavium]